MDLTDENISGFQMLYKKHFGVELTKAQALEKGLRLIRLVEIVARTAAGEQENTQNPESNPQWIP
jgi:hypothetical protein